MSKDVNISLALSLFCQYKRIAHDLHIKKMVIRTAIILIIGLSDKGKTGCWYV
jgi:fumarate reductase subunit D